MLKQLWKQVLQYFQPLRISCSAVFAPHVESTRAMTRERDSRAESENCESLLLPTADRRFDTKVKCPTGWASFWVKFPTVRSLTRVKCPGIARGRDGRFQLTGTLKQQDTSIIFGLIVLSSFCMGHACVNVQNAFWKEPMIIWIASVITTGTYLLSVGNL